MVLMIILAVLFYFFYCQNYKSNPVNLSSDLSIKDLINGSAQLRNMKKELD
jgi:hypothetical protein